MAFSSRTARTKKLWPMIDRLFTLLLAYAMAGYAGVTGAPDAA